MPKKLYKKEKYDNRLDWLKSRAIGGSSASALFNANPYMSALDVYCAAVNPNVNENEDDNPTESQEYGMKAESIMRDIVKLNLGSKYKLISPNGITQYRRIDKPYLTATLDGILVDLLTGAKWILEIKTHDVLNGYDLAKWKHSLPQNYFIQNIHYQVVLNDFVGSICVAKLRFFKTNECGERVIDREEIRYYRMPRSVYAKDIALCEEVETAFYENHIAKHIPPDIEIKF